MTMYTRLSTELMQGNSQKYVQMQQFRLNRIQEKLASGVNIQKASDDPLNSTRLQQLQEATADDEQYTRNIGQMLSELNTVDSSISDVVSLAQRARELAVQAGNDTLNQANLTAISQEVDQLINQAVQVGNTKLGQRYVFAGFAGQTQPFSRTGNNVTFNGTPSTPVPGYSRPAELAAGVTVSQNVDGTALLGTVTTGGAPEAATGGSGLMRTLTTLKLALQQGDKTTIRSQIGQLGTDLDNITTLQSDVGARVNRLELVKERLDTRKAVLQREMGAIQDIDIAKTISDLSYQQTLYQASLKVNADILQTTLMDYLR
jgi:flagellar hook-associated protein 3 FlgL